MSPAFLQLFCSTDARPCPLSNLKATEPRRVDRPVLTWESVFAASESHPIKDAFISAAVGRDASDVVLYCLTDSSGSVASLR